MALDREKLIELLGVIGKHLHAPATICLIGSAPGIMSGQPERQSSDLDVWGPASDFDTTDFRDACIAAGILFDPKGEVAPDCIYVQIVNPGVVRLPKPFEVDVLGRFGKLTVTMPEPALLAAAKLVRSDPRDIEDIAWWLKEKAIPIDDVTTAIRSLPNTGDREAAEENVILVELLVSPARKR